MGSSVQVIVLLKEDQSVQLQASKTSLLTLAATTARTLKFDLNDSQCQCSKFSFILNYYHTHILYVYISLHMVCEFITKGPHVSLFCTRPISWDKESVDVLLMKYFHFHFPFSNSSVFYKVVTFLIIINP